MIGAISVEFSQLILMKIIKIVATRCQISSLKCTKFNFGWGSAPDTAGEAYSAPRWIKGPTFKGEGKARSGWRGGAPSTFTCGSMPMLTITITLHVHSVDSHIRNTDRSQNNSRRSATKTGQCTTQYATNESKI